MGLVKSFSYTPHASFGEGVSLTLLVLIIAMITFLTSLAGSAGNVFLLVLDSDRTCVSLIL